MRSNFQQRTAMNKLRKVIKKYSTTTPIEPHTIDRCSILRTFLLGTVDQHSALRILRGQEDVLRLIWTILCEEWWDLHIHRYPDDEIPDLSPQWRTIEPSYPEERQICGGCPIATVARHIIFPPQVHLPLCSVDHQTSEHLYVNMMPFDITDFTTLPSFLSQYIPIIEECKKFLHRDHFLPSKTAFLTVDERPVNRGQSQRRGGLHVEAPGCMHFKGHSGKLKEGARTGGLYTPGAEHHWGGGLLMRGEVIEGGIFMASNTSSSCAVWNCQVDDANGEMVGMHGNVERLRDVLGPATRTLDAGELVWMTDKTPHESLPLRSETTRQYFRLVVGEVSVWYRDHSTSNPLGYKGPQQVIEGDKFKDVYKPKTYGWKYGTPAEIEKKREEKEFRKLLFEYGLGHLLGDLKELGVISVEALKKLSLTDNFDEKIKLIFRNHGSYYYEVPTFQRLVTDVKTNK